jgi:hypothetical protein
VVVTGTVLVVLVVLVDELVIVVVLVGKVVVVLVDVVVVGVVVPQSLPTKWRRWGCAEVTGPTRPGLDQ